MTRTTEIICDGCGADLTYTGNCEDYYLVVKSASKLSRGGFVTEMAKYPPIKREHDFCDLVCLDHWRARRHHFEALSRDWWNSWKAEHGTKDANGRIFSYPEAPRQLVAERNEEFEATALAAYPMARPRT